MRLVLTTVCLAIWLLGAFDQKALAQQTCSCQKVPGSTCTASVTCSGGCSAICGSGDKCFVSCKTDLIGPNLTLDIKQKDGKAIADELSAKTKMRISFVPYRTNVGELYDYQLKKSDIWKLLVFLDKVGNVKVNGVSFDKLRQLQKQIKSGQRITVEFIAIPAELVAERLAFLSGTQVNITSGDPAKPISLKAMKTTFPRILEMIESQTGIRMEMTKLPDEN